MKPAVDTSILVRLITGDEERQSEKARALVERSPVVVVVQTVVLETEWVLRNVYRFDREMIDTAFSALLGKPNVEIVEEQRLLLALEFLRQGMDFADAFHLAGSSDCDEFVTFDRNLARRAADASNAISVRLL